jgi:acyl-CoA reductase-like NAD-dependent aldehyde dehydrogenase
MTDASAVAALEALAVGLYESDCRERAGDMARRTTLSRIRAHYGFPAWAKLSARERGAWRRMARAMVEEQIAQDEEAAEWGDA